MPSVNIAIIQPTFRYPLSDTIGLFIEQNCYMM